MIGAFVDTAVATHPSHRRGRTRWASLPIAGLLVATAGSASPALAVPVSYGGILSFFAGTGIAGAPTAGAATSSKLDEPRAVAIFGTSVYIADTNNNRIEKVDTTTGLLSVFAGTGANAVPVPGPAINSPLYGPSGLAVDGTGNVYIADSSNNRVEKVTPGGTLSVIAGTTAAGTPVPGLATASPLNYPVGVVLDSANNIYIGDSGSNQVLKIDTLGVLSVFAGSPAGTAGAATQGQATSSLLSGPRAVAVDSSDNIYIADTDNYRVEKVTAGVLSFFAGTGTSGTPVPGLATATPLKHADGVEVDGANVYIADSNAHRIEKVTGGQLTFIAGTGTAGPATAGPALNSALNVPVDVGVDAAHNIYIVDSFNHRVEVVSAATAPAPPTGLSATPGNASAMLSFTPGPAGGAPITGYEVSTDNGATWAALATTAGTGGTLTGTVTGLTNYTTYTVRVRADNSVGTGTPSASTTVTPAPTPIQGKYNSMGGPSSFLGATIGPELAVPGGAAQQYEGGWIYYSAATGAHEVHGAILAKYRALGDVTSILGYPTSDESAAPGGRVSTYSNGDIYYSEATGPHEVNGAIKAHYDALGGPGGVLGYPVTDERVTPDGVGRYNHFEGGSIYWSPDTGAHAVYGAIRAKWAALGWERGVAGYPTADEADTPGGRVGGFAGARIYWSPSTGAFELNGEILARYLALGGSGGIAGFPVTDETDVAGVPGARMNVFSAANLAIYWSAETGAHEVLGAIRGYYTDAAGGPSGRLGLPTSGEYGTPTGRASNFVYGVVTYDSATGQVGG